MGPGQLGATAAPARTAGPSRSAEKPDAPPVDAARPGHSLPSRRARQPGADLRRRPVRSDAPTTWPTGSPPPTASICGRSSCPTIICAAIRYLPVSAVTLDIPEHGAGVQACTASARSRPGAWSGPPGARAVPTPKRFPPTELVPGGYVTSACSPLDLHGRPVSRRTIAATTSSATRPTTSSTATCWCRKGADFIAQPGRCRLRVPGLDGQLVPPRPPDARSRRRDLRPRFLSRGDRDAVVAAGGHQEAGERGKPWPRSHLAYCA